MTHYDIHYNGSDREKNDRKAIIDSLQYISNSLAKRKEFIRALKDPEPSIMMVNRILANIVGIQGYPFHALMRRYRLADYRAWMHDGKDPVLTDEQGFQLEKEST